MTEVIAFEYKKAPGRYAADGPEMALFFGDENGNVRYPEKALVVLREDLKPPRDKDVNAFYEAIKELEVLDFEQFKNLYREKRISIDDEQLDQIKERRGF